MAGASSSIPARWPNSTTPNQIIGVLAHETGHIAGGHLSKLRQELANVQTAAMIAMLARRRRDGGRLAAAAAMPVPRRPARRRFQARPQVAMRNTAVLSARA